LELLLFSVTDGFSAFALEDSSFGGSVFFILVSVTDKTVALNHSATSPYIITGYEA